MREGKLLVRLSDLLEGAPLPVLAAIAHILLAKMYRKPVEREAAARYRRYVSSHDITRKAHLVRQIRGRKRLHSAQGRIYDLEAVFEDLNTQIFPRTSGQATAGLEPQPFPQQPGSLRSRSQCHRGEPDLRSSASSEVRRRLHRLPRDASPQTSSETEGQSPMCSLRRIPGGGEAVPSTARSETISKAFVALAVAGAECRESVPPSPCSTLILPA